MTLTGRARELYEQLTTGKPKFGDLKKIAKEVKRDHELAMELWETGEYYPRLLAALIFDKKMLTTDVIESLAVDVEVHTAEERAQLADWLLANQLNKDKKTLALIDTWEQHTSPFLRRIFWFHQGRLRWTGKEPPANTEALLSSLDSSMESEDPEVQRMMNFAAAQIGIHQNEYRGRCVALGERLKLYIDEPVPRGCVSPYLPIWIETEVAKLQ